MHNTPELRVVVAEDDFLVGKDVERVLKMKGYEIVGRAVTGEQAVEMVRKLRPDIVLMDIKMPKMDGLQATELIQQSCPTPIVILTVHETHDFLERASAVGAGAYLIKPPSPEDVERSITIARARHQDIMHLRELLAALEEKNKELEKALGEIKTLQGILPICMHCKGIRDDDGAWNQLEKYITEHSDAQFSHGICDKCLKEHYPDYNITLSVNRSRIRRSGSDETT
ncbi:MAG: response regulator [Deltaproteobacteria bacterium]|nr:response regulator [Deltaproteobacteria bacterium]